MTLAKDIYNNIFGKDQEPIWRQFSSERKGNYLPIYNHRVQYVHEGFTITLDAHSIYRTVGPGTFETEYIRGVA